MKEIVKFCKKNNFNFEMETLSNGVSRAVIKNVNFQDVEKIKEKAKKQGLYAVATAYGNERDIAVYNSEGWKEMMKRFKPDINTIDDMIDVLTKAKNLLGGDALFTVLDDFGSLRLSINNNIIISGGELVINASDWNVLNKDIDF